MNAIDYSTDEIEALRLKARWFDAIVDQAPINIYLKDQDKRLLWVNHRFAETFGRPPESFVGRVAAEHLTEELVRSVLNHDREVMEGARPVVREEEIDGRTLRVLKCPVLGESGEVSAIIGFDIDITELKSAERKLREQAESLEEAVSLRTSELRRSEAQFRTLIEGSIQGVLIADEGQRLLFANAKAAEIFGYGSAEEIVALGRMNRLLAADDRERVETYHQAQFQGEEAPEIYEARGVRSDGSVVWFESYVTLTQWSGRPALQVTVVDITNRKQVEAALLQSQKLNALGQLSGGIAHDFNNLLAVMTANAEMLADLVEEDSEAMPRITSILRMVDQGSSLTNRLLSFGRKQALAPAKADLRSLLDGLQEMMQRVLGETIELRSLHPSDLWPARADPHQLEQAVLNLAINGRDAMPRGGVLTIATDNVILGERLPDQVGGPPPGEYVSVTITDNGVGMTPEVLERALEPFFTTKDTGQGSGLGLSMAYGFARQSGGDIEIESEAGQGTTVRLFLPRSTDDADDVVRTMPTTHSPRGSERILVVEDDADLRAVTARALGERGYRVVTAADGQEALRLLDEGQRFDLLFADIVLPRGINGLEVAERARRIQPDIKVLHATGYAGEADIGAGSTIPGDLLIYKPYRQGELMGKVRASLDHAEDG